MVCMDVFKNSLGDPQPICKYDILKKKIHLAYYIIYYTWMSFLHLHYIYYHNTLTSLALNILSMYYNKVLKNLKFFVHFIILKCMIHTQMHLCFTFSFNNYTFRFNDPLNNALFMF